METLEGSYQNNISVQSIIDRVNSIVNPCWKFNMDDIYGDRGGIPYPAIEELKNLHFKLDSKQNPQQTSDECNQMLETVKNLNIGDVRIIKVMGVGKFILIELTDKVFIEAYDNYIVFANTNQEKINKIYEKLNKQIPKEFIGFKLFYNN